MSKFLDENGLSYFWSKIKASLKTVAFTGSYNDLTNKPNIPQGATVDTALNSSSTNPVQNKAIHSALATKVTSAQAIQAVSGAGYATSANASAIASSLISAGGYVTSTYVAGATVASAGTATNAASLGGVAAGNFVRTDNVNQTISGTKTFVKTISANGFRATTSYGLHRDVADDRLIVYGASDSTKGAYLLLYGKDHTSNGLFTLATVGSSTYSLTGKQDGTLTWNGGVISATTFSGNATTATNASSLGGSAASVYAKDSAVVHISEAEVISGGKTFLTGIGFKRPATSNYLDIVFKENNDSIFGVIRPVPETDATPGLRLNYKATSGASWYNGPQFWINRAGSFKLRATDNTGANAKDLDITNTGITWNGGAINIYPDTAYAVGTATGLLNVRYKNAAGSTNYATDVITVIGTDGTDGYNVPISIGSNNGTTQVGAGESRRGFLGARNLYNNENLYLTADGSVNIFTNCANDNATYAGPVTFTGTASASGGKINVTGLGTVTATTFSGTATSATAVTGTAGTSTLSWNTEVTLATVGGNAIKAKLPANPNTNTTYTFATGDSNGQIKVTPSGGTAQNVAVKGLGTAAYTASTAYAAASHTHSYLPLDGGTLTGSLTISRGNPYLFFVETDWSKGTPQTSGTSYQGIYFSGSNAEGGHVTYHYGQDKNSYLSIAAQNLASASATGTTTILVENASGEKRLRPKTNNDTMLGHASYKWSTVYATTFSGALAGNATTATNASSLGGKAASQYLTAHQSLANYVTLNGTQTITGAKTFSGQNITVSAGNIHSYINGGFYAHNASDTVWGSMQANGSNVFGLYFNTGSKWVVHVNSAGTATFSGSLAGSSDERLKGAIATIDGKILDAWDKVDWRQFKYNSEVAEKGKNAPTHVGLVAQHVSNCLVENGVDADSLHIIGNDYLNTAEEDTPDEYVVYYVEALCMEAAYQRRRAERAEARITALEQRFNELEEVLVTLGDHSNAS